MLRRMLLLLVGLCCIHNTANADLFESTGRKYGIDPYLLRAIAQQESDLKHWTLNINRESVVCPNKRGIVKTLKHISKRPYILVAKHRHGTGYKPYGCVYNNKENLHYRWFRSAEAARQHARAYKLKVVRITKRNVKSTDIGIMQINWRWHEQHVTSINKLLDVSYNVEYAASLLRKLIKAHGLYEAIGRYHNNTDEQRKRNYRSRVIAIYNSLRKTRT